MESRFEFGRAHHLLVYLTRSAGGINSARVFFMTINLNNCSPGQKLKSSLGQILTYVGRTPEGNYYDHYVRYPNGSLGTRTNDGYVFKNASKRMLDCDHDIVEIL